MLGRKKTPTPEAYEKGRIYDYSTREGREATVAWLHQEARKARTAQENEWVRYNDYYNFIHGVTDEVREAARESGIEWDPAVVPDPFIMVESQVDPVVPEPEFRGRDDDQDSEKAKQREYAVKYILQENRIDDMNTANEKRLRKLGDAFWKAYWDADMDCGPYEGNIRIRDVPVQDVYPDPTAGADGLQAGQFVDYVYTVHKLKFWRMFGRELKKLGLTLEDMMSGDYQEKGGLFDLVTSSSERSDTVQVLEHWYKQPFDVWISAGGGAAGSPASQASAQADLDAGPIDSARADERDRVPRRRLVPAGSIACSVQAGGHEIKYIPQYWERTGRQNQLFPFVHYWCVRDENSFWNKSELMPIIGLVDAADRCLANGQLNDAFTANDIVLVEEGAMADGEEFTNIPGAVVRVKQNRVGAVARLGGLHDGKNSLPMVNWHMEQIQRTNRNYETNMGKESARVTTASGLAQLRSDADAQSKIKKADRNAGFMRLYELLDWLALEFFDDDRLLFLGAKKPGEEPVSLHYNGDSFGTEIPPVLDALSGTQVREGYTYYPRVDVTVNAGDGVIRSKAATLEALDKLSAIPVTEDNYKLLEAEIEILDIPQKQDIVELWEKKFAPIVPPEITAALESDPELLSAVQQAVTAMQSQATGVQAPGEGMGIEAPAGTPVGPAMAADMSMGGGVPR